MNIALLNEKVTIQKQSAAADRIGNHKNVWEDYFTCHATIGNEGKSERSEIAVEGEVVDHVDMDVTVRFCRETAPVNCTGYRLVFRGELYDILAVDHLNFRNRCIRLRCRKVRR